MAPCGAARCGTPWCVTPPLSCSSDPSFSLCATSNTALGGPCRDRALLELHGQEQSPAGCHGLRAAETCWWHRGWQLGSEELLTQTFPSQVHGPKAGVGPVCASGWTSHHGYWDLFTSINYFFILKRHLERDRASRGTDTIKALRKQNPVSQPGCGTVAMPQQGMLVGVGGCCSPSLSPAGGQAKGSCQLGPGDQPSPKGSVMGFASLQQEPSTTCHSCQGIFGTGMWVENPQECQSHGQSPK